MAVLLPMEYEGEKDVSAAWAAGVAAPAAAGAEPERVEVPAELQEL